MAIIFIFSLWTLSPTPTHALFTDPVISLFTICFLSFFVVAKTICSSQRKKEPTKGFSFRSEGAKVVSTNGDTPCLLSFTWEESFLLCALTLLLLLHLTLSSTTALLSNFQISTTLWATEIGSTMLAIGVHGTSIRTSTTCTALLRELEVFLLLWCFRILGFEEFVGEKKMRTWGVFFFCFVMKSLLVIICSWYVYPFLFFFVYLLLLLEYSLPNDVVFLFRSTFCLFYCVKRERSTDRVSVGYFITEERGFVFLHEIDYLSWKGPFSAF